MDIFLEIMFLRKGSLYQEFVPEKSYFL
jgi:hypothetical protein